METDTGTENNKYKNGGIQNDTGFFKDILFELLNDMDEHMLADIVADDRKNSFALWMADGCGFEIKCRKLEGRMQKNAEC